MDDRGNECFACVFVNTITRNYVELHQKEKHKIRN